MELLDWAKLVNVVRSKAARGGQSGTCGPPDLDPDPTLSLTPGSRGIVDSSTVVQHIASKNIGVLWAGGEAYCVPSSRPRRHQ